MRPYTEYADRKYVDGEEIAHLVAFGEDRSLCGVFAHDWYGTGDWHETETAAWMRLCQECHAHAYPSNAHSDEDPAVAQWRQTLNK